MWGCFPIWETHASWHEAAVGPTLGQIGIASSPERSGGESGVDEGRGVCRACGGYLVDKS